MLRRLGPQHLADQVAGRAVFPLGQLLQSLALSRWSDSQVLTCAGTAPQSRRSQRTKKPCNPMSSVQPRVGLVDFSPAGANKRGGGHLWGSGAGHNLPTTGSPTSRAATAGPRKKEPWGEAGGPTDQGSEHRRPSGAGDWRQRSALKLISFAEVVESPWTRLRSFCGACRVCPRLRVIRRLRNRYT